MALSNHIPASAKPAGRALVLAPFLAAVAEALLVFPAQQGQLVAPDAAGVEADDGRFTGLAEQ